MQLIRRNPRTLVFYARLALLQKVTGDPHDQSWGNRLLRFEDAPVWDHLPLTYSSESNGGARPDSVLYHANGTVTNSLNRKEVQLERARAVARKGD